MHRLWVQLLSQDWPGEAHLQCAWQGEINRNWSHLSLCTCCDIYKKSSSKLVQFRSPCPVCGKKYSDLRQHVRIVHEGAKVGFLVVFKNLIIWSPNLFDVIYIQAECPHCKGKYSNLSQHIHKVHLKTKNIMCDKCGMTFYHNSNLKKHLETAHTGSRLMAVQPSVYPILGHPADMVGFHSIKRGVILTFYTFCSFLFTKCVKSQNHPPFHSKM